MFDARLLLLKRDAREAATDGGDLLQLRRPANLLSDDELFFCRERISPAGAVLRPEAGVVSSAEGIDRVVGLLDLGHCFGQTSPHGPADLLPALLARLFHLAVHPIRLLLFLCGVGSRVC